MATTTRKLAAKPAATEATKSLKTAAPRKSAVSRTAQSTQPIAKPQSEALVKPKTKKTIKVKKPKLVRDRFTIPKTEYAVLDELKQRADKLAHPVKKSELLRAGVKALAAMPDGAFLSALNVVPSIKPGRPKDNRAK
ncbi:MAG TPA: hypothetical protein DCP03_21000 [Polaromonas sp.]|uniref:hypothetical protein n=1 Tax=Polaromonas sp. UBA4122 TaxID=1947074 RepID=UPI000EBF85C1|nr:hypothetical protein [Polaromonas sp. UBA4122]HAL40434.1 hypothetical protein [Polaromonas sp.]